MAAEIRARTRASVRRKNTVILSAITLLSVFALVMTVYNFVKGNWLFCVAWLIALILAATYVFIRMNTVFPTYIAADRVNLYMKNWSNDFLPYDCNNKIRILSEFIPAKTKLVEIPLDEIHVILIGTKNFIKRNTDESSSFHKSLKKLEKTKDFYKKKTLSSMDIIYVETYANECYYMPIVNFETKDVMKIVQTMQRKNADLELKCSSRDYRRFLAK